MSSSKSDPASSGDEKTRIRLCGVGDVGEGGALKVEAGDLLLAVFNVEGTFFVVDDTCSHGAASLSEGLLDGHTIECDLHGGGFDLRTGEATIPPCVVPIRTYKVVLDDDSVFIEL